MRVNRDPSSLVARTWETKCSATAITVSEHGEIYWNLIEFAHGQNDNDEAGSSPTSSWCVKALSQCHGNAK